jgi:hypothetical protein
MDKPLILEILIRALERGYKLAPRCTRDGYPIVYRTEKGEAGELLKEIYVLTEESAGWFASPEGQPAAGLPTGFPASAQLNEVLDYLATRNAK